MKIPINPQERIDRINLVNSCRHVGDADYGKLIEQMIKIEQFVTTIIDTARELRKVGRLCRSELFNRVHDITYALIFINRWVHSYDAQYEYSPAIKIFYSACFQLNIQCVRLDESSKLYGDLIELIAAKAETSEFIKQCCHHRYKWQRNYESATDYVNCLFHNHSRLMVLRIDLGYNAQHTGKVTPEQARTDFAKFMNNYRHNKTLITACKGYIWKLEYGEDKGCHFHLMLFYDGSKVQQDINWAQRIGEYWMQSIGAEIGYYWNCNANKKEYRYQGIGMVRRNDAEVRKHLVQYVLKYLFKTEQYLIARPLAYTSIRTFGKGQCARRDVCKQPALLLAA